MGTAAIKTVDEGNCQQARREKERIIRGAAANPDRWVVAMDYVDSKGARTGRMVSPIRFLGSDRFLALCLCREEPRQFSLNRCENVHFVPAAEVIMPVMLEAYPRVPGNAVHSPATVG